MSLKQQNPVAPPGLLRPWPLVTRRVSLLPLMADNAKRSRVFCCTPKIQNKRQQKVTVAVS